MLSQAPSRLHHSRTPSVDWRPIIPISSMMAHSKACRVSTHTTGASRAAATAFQSLKVSTAQSESSQMEKKTTARGKGQYRQLVVKKPPKLVGIDSAPPRVVSPHRMAP